MPKFWEENFLKKYNQIFEESSNSWIEDEYLTLIKVINDLKSKGITIIYICYNIVNTKSTF